MRSLSLKKRAAQGELFEDINFEAFISEKELDIRKVDLDVLKSTKIFYHDQVHGAFPLHWSVYKCTYCEVDYSGQRYVLVSGNWYVIDKKYAKDINEQLKDIPGIFQRV